MEVDSVNEVGKDGLKRERNDSVSNFPSSSPPTKRATVVVSTLQE